MIFIKKINAKTSHYKRYQMEIGYATQPFGTIRMILIMMQRFVLPRNSNVMKGIIVDVSRIVI